MPMLNNKTWFIDNAETLKAIHSVNAKKFNGFIDDIKEYYTPRETYSRNDGYSIVSIYTPMVNKTDAYSAIAYLRSYEDIASDMQLAIEDSNDIIILDMDSGGGVASGISQAIEAIAEAKKTKKVYAFVSGICASACYWLASQCDKIIMDSTAQVGSIGAMIAGYDFDLESIGIKEFRFVSDISPNKNPEIGSDKFNDDMQETVNVTGRLFVEAVASGRGVTFEKVVNDFGGGKMFFSQEAISRGMADSVGTIKTLIEEVYMSDKKDTVTADKPTVDITAIVAEAISTERLRVGSIMSHPNTKTQETLAKICIEQGMTAEQSKVILDAVIPQEAVIVAEKPKSTLDALMAISENNPVIKSISAELPVDNKDATGNPFANAKEIIKKAGIK
jgi:ClpP class serine protease